MWIVVSRQYMSDEHVGTPQKLNNTFADVVRNALILWTVEPWIVVLLACFFAKTHLGYRLGLAVVVCGQGFYISWIVHDFGAWCCSYKGVGMEVLWDDLGSSLPAWSGWYGCHVLIGMSSLVLMICDVCDVIFGRYFARMGYQVLISTRSYVYVAVACTGCMFLVHWCAIRSLKIEDWSL